MSIPEELDRRAEKLNKKLQGLLALYLLGKYSAGFIKALARQLILDEYVSFMVWFRLEYGTPDNYDTQARRIREVLDRVLADFNAVIDGEGATEFYRGEEGKKKRTWLIALALIYGLHGSATVELAITLKTRLIYNTQEDARVCDLCDSLKGAWSPDDPLLPQLPIHGDCRCFWSLVV